MGLRRALVQVATAATLVLDVHTLINVRAAYRPRPLRQQWDEPVSILLPMRNEASRLEACLASVIAQRGLTDVEILILDDGSSDGTGDLVRAIAHDDPRVRVIDGPDDPPPPGWLGKPWACHRLATQAVGAVLVFVDADVVLDPWAITTAVHLMRAEGLALLSPYPRQVAPTWLGRITQPMVNWSWLATLPLHLARGLHPLWSAAIGQFLVVDAQAYRDAGGHAVVAGCVIEDVEVLRALKRAGYRGMPAIGGDIASCRMYDTSREVVYGYSKSLWSAFGSTPRALGGCAAMTGFYVLPVLLGATTRDRTIRRWAVLAYVSGVAGRVAVSRATRERVLPDSLAMPASAAAFALLTVRSLVLRRRDGLRWKGRPVVSATEPVAPGRGTWGRSRTLKSAQSARDTSMA